MNQTTRYFDADHGHISFEAAKIVVFENLESLTLTLKVKCYFNFAYEMSLQ